MVSIILPGSQFAPNGNLNICIYYFYRAIWDLKHSKNIWQEQLDWLLRSHGWFPPELGAKTGNTLARRPAAAARPGSSESESGAGASPGPDAPPAPSSSSEWGPWHCSHLIIKIPGIINKILRWAWRSQSQPRAGLPPAPSSSSEWGPVTLLTSHAKDTWHHYQNYLSQPGASLSSSSVNLISGVKIKY